jgi:hypothetical protein
MNRILYLVCMMMCMTILVRTGETMNLPEKDMTITDEDPQINEAGINKQDERSLMGIIQAILNDPEFLSLNKTQQLSVLTIIYNMILKHYTQTYVL